MPNVWKVRDVFNAESHQKESTLYEASPEIREQQGIVSVQVDKDNTIFLELIDDKVAAEIVILLGSTQYGSPFGRQEERSKVWISGFNPRNLDAQSEIFKRFESVGPIEDTDLRRELQRAFDPLGYIANNIKGGFETVKRFVDSYYRSENYLQLREAFVKAMPSDKIEDKIKEEFLFRLESIRGDFRGTIQNRDPKYAGEESPNLIALFKLVESARTNGIPLENLINIVIEYEQKIDKENKESATPFPVEASTYMMKYILGRLYEENNQIDKAKEIFDDNVPKQISASMSHDLYATMVKAQVEINDKILLGLEGKGLGETKEGLDYVEQSLKAQLKLDTRDRDNVRAYTHVHQLTHGRKPAEIMLTDFQAEELPEVTQESLIFVLMGEIRKISKNFAQLEKDHKALKEEHIALLASLGKTTGLTLDSKAVAPSTASATQVTASSDSKPVTATPAQQSALIFTSGPPGSPKIGAEARETKEVKERKSDAQQAPKDAATARRPKPMRGLDEDD